MTTTDPTAPATPGETLDLDAIEREWLVQCGPCDFGLVQYGCQCPSGDYRWVIQRLVAEVRQMRSERSGDQYELDNVRAELRRVRADPDAARATDPAPATPPEHQPGARFALPAQPEGPLWDNIGRRWERSGFGGWAHTIGEGERRSSLHMNWHELLDFVTWLSSTPPAGTEDEPTVDRCLSCNGELIRDRDGRLRHRGGGPACGVVHATLDPAELRSRLGTEPASATAVDPPARTVGT